MIRFFPEWRKTAFEPSSAVAAAAGAVVAGGVCCGALPWYLPVPAAAAAWLCFSRPKAVMALAAGVLTLACFLLREAMSQPPIAGARSAYGTMTLRMIDPRVSRIGGLSLHMRSAAAELVDFEDGAERKNCRGTQVFALFPRGLPPPVCGTLVAAEGELVSPEAVRNSGGDFDFRKFLKRRRFTAVVRIRRFRTTGREPGLRGRLTDMRDAVLETLFRGVNDLTVRQLAAALYCGVGAGMPEDLRSRFAAAGIVMLLLIPLSSIIFRPRNEAR